MAKRRTIHVLKNNQVNNGALPTSGVQMGEPLVNLYNGILFFSGTTGGNYVQSNSNPGYFEVGSNLYNLELRNQITRYQNTSGVGLEGKFLSGTTTGFVLADISTIQGVVTDSYTTGATWSPNVLTLTLNNGKPDVTATINSFTGLNLFGTTNATNLVVTGTTNLQNTTVTNLYASSSVTANTGTFSTLITTGNLSANNVYASNSVTANTGNINTINSTTGSIFNLSVPGTGLVNNLTITGTGLYNITVGSQGPFEIANVNYVTAYTQSREVYVTGGTITTTPSNSDKNGVIGLRYNQTIPNGTYTLPFSDTFTTGATLSGTLISFTKNDSTTYSVDLSSLNPTGFTDTFVTGFTYNNANTLTISRSQGKPDLSVTINQMSGLTLTDNLIVSGRTSINNLLVNGFVLGNLIPNTGCTYDLGSTTNRWRDAWVNKVKIGTCTTTLEDDNTQFIISVGGVSSGATINLNGGNLNVGGNLLPTNNLNYDLGSATKKWNTIYASNISTSALTITGLAANRVVYTNASGNLATETGFNYDETTDRMTVGALTVNNAVGTTSSIGQGGLTIGSGGSSNTPGVGNLTVHGNLVIFGTGTTITTNELYIEDPQITLNYNPSGSSITTSIASGIKIQDGSGVANSDVLLTVAQMNTFTGGAVTEYSGPTGYSNRAFLTQLNDIVIRNTNSNNGAPDGVRVLAEHDILDGGSY